MFVSVWDESYLSMYNIVISSGVLNTSTGKYAVLSSTKFTMQGWTKKIYINLSYEEN